MVTEPLPNSSQFLAKDGFYKYNSEYEGRPVKNNVRYEMTYEIPHNYKSLLGNKMIITKTTISQVGINMILFK